MNHFLWALTLFLLGLGLAALEVFVPSGSALTILSLLAFIGALIFAFSSNVYTGIGFVGALVITLPALLAVAVRIWPHTPIGRRALQRAPRRDQVEQDDEPRRLLRSLVGRVGQARSRMLPSGAVQVDGHVIDALSEGLAIEPGAWVKVVAVRGMQVVVRPTEERPGQASRPAPVREPAGGDLDRSLQELGLDDLPVPPPPEETDGTTGVR